MLVTLMRQREIWKRREERTIVCVHAIAERIIWSSIRVSRAEPKRLDEPRHSSVAAGERAQVDVGHVVLEAAAVREPSEIAGQHAKPVSLSDLCCWRNACIQSQQVCYLSACEVQAR